MSRSALACCIFLIGISNVPASASSVLFDASHHEMAGNADWVVDADAWNLSLPAYPCSGSTLESNPARTPTPPQSGITATTPETYWTGGISSWAVELVKAGHTVESLPDGGRITFGDGTNPQDLSNYKLFIAVEPQIPFSAAEKSAILAFVSAGGGLFVVGDHETSDRDCDGWDSPHVWNDLTGAVSPTQTGVFGIWFRVDGSDAKPSEDWFDEGVNNNVETSPADPIIHGPFGSGAGGLGLFGSTSMELNPADNATVAGHVWRNGQAHGTSRVTFATASYGSGRVAAIGDSSPADDGTGDSGDTLYGGWDKATGGVNNREIHLNACAWLLNPPPDVTAPAITGGPSASPLDCSATVSWTTDEPATSAVAFGPTASYGSAANAPGLTQSHAVVLAPLSSSTVYHYQAASSDAAGNGPTTSADATFTTGPPAAPVVVSGPGATGVGATSATIAWTTDEPATSQVDYGTTASYGSSASVPGTVTAHAVTLTGLTPETLYHYRVLSADACGNGPVVSADATFTTGAPSIDVSGWVLKQYTSSISWSIPAGTTLPSGGYLVVGRNATPAEFSAYYPAMPPPTIYLNSNATGSCSAGCFPQINGDETYELYDPASVKKDGATVAVNPTHQAWQRKNPGDPAGVASSWTVVPESSANPGQGAGTPGGAGVRINEFSDASDFNKEFVELYFDAGSAPPDAVPPATPTDLVATPVSDTAIRVSWTAVGDDGTVGTAAAYDVRMSTAGRILTDSDFAAATPLPGEPAPLPAGTAQQMSVTGLTASTAYYFAMKVQDDAGNLSGLSNTDWAVTAPTGGGPPPATHLVISQVQTNGDGGTPADDEFVELYNPTGTPVALSGLSVQYKSATGTTYSPFVLPASHTIPSHGWYLVARSAYNGSPAADATNSSFQMAAAGGNLFLVNGTSALPSASCSTSSAILDKVAWGTGNCPESSAPAAPAASNAIARKPGGTSGAGQDTDNNSGDFQTLAPSAPHDRLSPPAVPPSVLGNVGSTLFLSAQASGTLLDWANAAGATGYRLYRGDHGGFLTENPAPWLTPAESRAVDAASPAPGSAFFYVVRATNGSSESGD